MIPSTGSLTGLYKGSKGIIFLFSRRVFLLLLMPFPFDAESVVEPFAADFIPSHLSRAVGNIGLAGHVGVIQS